jgi:hypothetical protein
VSYCDGDTLKNWKFVRRQPCTSHRRLASHMNQLEGTRTSSVSRVTRPQAGRTGFDSQEGQIFALLTSTPAHTPACIPIRWAMCFFARGSPPTCISCLHIHPSCMPIMACTGD